MKERAERRYVRLTYDHDEVGYVLAEGPAVTEIKFPTGERFILNRHVEDLPKDAAINNDKPIVPRRGRKPAPPGIARRERA